MWELRGRWPESTNFDNHRVTGAASPFDFGGGGGFTYCSAMRRLGEELRVGKEGAEKN